MLRRWKAKFARRWALVLPLFLAAVAMSAAGARWIVQAEGQATPDLARWMPAGALLAIQSPDFAKLLNEWERSPEQKAWLASDNYAVFSRSRLFGRLQQAQADFAGAAGLPVNDAFLRGVAGQRSLFAWYDIGQLQVVFVTRMPPEMQKRSALLAQAKRFERREVAGTAFYVHSGDASDAPAEAKAEGDGGGGLKVESGGEAKAEDDDASDHDAEQSSAAGAGGESRTVAFATRGEWMVLATDETLMARTLQLMAAASGSGEGSLAVQDWYADLMAKAPAEAGELRMAIDLSRVVKSPYFRSYWIQGNVTEMSHNRAALCDLYEEAQGLREERVLLPAGVSEADAAGAQNADLGALTAMVPAGAAVYRAVAQPDDAAVVDAVRDKVLHLRSGGPQAQGAPTADVSSPLAGSATELESRIDETALQKEAGDGVGAALREWVQAVHARAMLTVDAHGVDAKAAPGAWVPFRSAVVLEAEQAVDERGLQAALSSVANGALSANALGVSWMARPGGYSVSSDARPLVMAVRGKQVLLADDEALMRALLAARTPERSAGARVRAGVDFTVARPAFLRWTRMVDGVNGASGAQGDAGDNPDQTPAFFGRNVASLSTAFAALARETYEERADGDLLRETVTYRFLTNTAGR